MDGRTNGVGVFVLDGEGVLEGTGVRLGREVAEGKAERVTMRSEFDVSVG